MGSNGGTIALPPSSSALAAVSSTSRTQKSTLQFGGAPFGGSMMATTSRGTGWLGSPPTYPGRCHMVISASPMPNALVSQAQKTAPAGSASTTWRPPAGDSNGVPITEPPASSTLAVVSSALSTQTWVPHAADGGGGAPCADTTAATGRPRSLHMK